MVTDLLPFLATCLAAVVCGLVLMVATRHPALLPGTVQPFAPSADPANDTLAEQAMTSTVLSDAGNWKVVTLSRLCDVEELLDCLEASGTAEREVHTFGNSTFAVRWR
jgi:hypothetical protein